MRPVCGSNTAYNSHTKHKETPCEPCRKAHALYRHEQRRNRLIKGPVMVPAFRAKRRIRALMRMGWTYDHIAEVAYPGSRAGSHTIYHMVAAAKVIHPNTFAVISMAYDKLSAHRGPSQKTRNHALRKGWPPPLAWDDIDDPECRPQGYLRPSDYKKLKNGLP